MLAVLLCPPTIALANGDREKGQKIAREQCKFCHVIGDGDKYSGISSTPSFYIFAEKWERYEERLRSFHTRLPHPARGFDPTADEIDNLVAYISKLERPDPSKSLKDN